MPLTGKTKPRRSGVGTRNADCSGMTVENHKLGQWIMVEHYRLHCVERWDDSPHKQAALAGIRSALEQLHAALPSATDSLPCMVCASRRREAVVLQFPSGSQEAPVNTRLAA